MEVITTIEAIMGDAMPDSYDKRNQTSAESGTVWGCRPTRQDWDDYSELKRMLADMQAYCQTLFC